MGDPIILNQQQLNELLAYWQVLLRLRDWDIKIAIKRTRDFKFDEAAGETTWLLAKKMAVITIVDPADYPPDSLWPQDMEMTLIHELVHLLLAYWTPERLSAEYDYQEQAIHTISQTLVRLQRGEFANAVALNTILKNNFDWAEITGREDGIGNMVGNT